MATLLPGMHVSRSLPHLELIWGQISVHLVSTIGSCHCLEGLGTERAGERNGHEVQSVKVLCPSGARTETSKEAGSGDNIQS